MLAPPKMVAGSGLGLPVASAHPQIGRALGILGGWMYRTRRTLAHIGIQAPPFIYVVATGDQNHLSVRMPLIRAILLG